MSEHTPGPWEIDFRPENHSRGALIRHHGVTIARLVKGDSKLPDEHQANARLIIAAPELKEILEWLIDQPQGCMCPNNGGGDCDWCEVVDSVRLIIEGVNNAT